MDGPAAGGGEGPGPPRSRSGRGVCRADRPGRWHPGHDVELDKPGHHDVLRQTPRHRIQPAGRRHPHRRPLRSLRPVPGSRHDIHAWRQSHFPEAFAERQSIADLGYIGSGLLTPRRKPPGQERSAGDKVANRSVNTLRATVERAIAHLKNWKILATRYRGPLTRFTLVAKAVTALAFYKKGW
ncbi:transposase family protein [Streptomyces noursei]|uniref:transposase family protein n=1 Tax=Streptomyces noursei TaxID=1971 RepID=UPI0037B404D6